MRVLGAPFLFTGAEPAPGAGHAPPTARLVADGALALDGDTVVAAGPRAEVEAAHGKAEPLDAVVLPALVNAHTHLELSHLAGQVPGGGGLPGWIGRFLPARAAAPENPALVERAVTALRAHGVAAVGEVTNTLAALPAMSRAGMAGRLYLEIFGLSASRIAAARRAALEMLDASPQPAPGLEVVLSPHAVYSTRPAVVAELLQAGPASIHLAEDPAERTFVASGAGPFGPLLGALGGEGDRPQGRSPVACVAGSLHAGNLAVHAVDLDDEDVEVLRRSGATAVLCPRSNFHIGGKLPDLPRLLAAGVRLAVGTDSLASSPSLSPLAELLALSRGYPQVPAARLLPLAWNGGAVGAHRVGRLAPGTAPGVLALPLEGARPADPAAWLLAAGAEGSFRWLARHRPEASA
ncbi:MAG: amidohydrolase family protein [Deltaproteobacteria bacterium]|nr:amidohydrolase family protein [Deltaproteobacteria bacterium]